MKKFIQFGAGFLLLCLSALCGCSSDEPSEPCNNTGQICVENKLDTNIVVSITQTHSQAPLSKDYMECFTLEANQAYTFSFSGNNINRPDTTIMVLPCDNKLIVIQ
jgi:hypothetical protein